MAFYARLDVTDPDNIVLLSSVQTLSGGEGWFEVVLTFELPFPDGKVPRVETHPTTGSYIIYLDDDETDYQAQALADLDLLFLARQAILKAPITLSDADVEAINGEVENGGVFTYDDDSEKTLVKLLKLPALSVPVQWRKRESTETITLTTIPQVSAFIDAMDFIQIERGFLADAQYLAMQGQIGTLTERDVSNWLDEYGAEYE